MMDGEKLGSEIKAAIDGVTDKNDHANLWKAAGRAIVSHIQDNAKVQAGIAVETAGSPSKQSGVTTETGTIQ